jgi:hypothetical protein
MQPRNKPRAASSSASRRPINTDGAPIKAAPVALPGMRPFGTQARRNHGTLMITAAEGRRCHHPRTETRRLNRPDVLLYKAVWLASQAAL